MKKLISCAALTIFILQNAAVLPLRAANPLAPAPKKTASAAADWGGGAQLVNWNPDIEAINRRVQAERKKLIDAGSGNTGLALNYFKGRDFFTASMRFFDVGDRGAGDQFTFTGPDNKKISMPVRDYTNGYLKYILYKLETVKPGAANNEYYDVIQRYDYVKNAYLALLHTDYLEEDTKNKIRELFKNALKTADKSCQDQWFFVGTEYKDYNCANLRYALPGAGLMGGAENEVFDFMDKNFKGNIANSEVMIEGTHALLAMNSPLAKQKLKEFYNNKARKGELRKGIETAGGIFSVERWSKSVLNNVAKETAQAQGGSNLPFHNGAPTGPGAVVFDVVTGNMNRDFYLTNWAEMFEYPAAGYEDKFKKYCDDNIGSFDSKQCSLIPTRNLFEDMAVTIAQADPELAKSIVGENMAERAPVLPLAVGLIEAGYDPGGKYDKAYFAKANYVDWSYGTFLRIRNLAGGTVTPQEDELKRSISSAYIEAAKWTKKADFIIAVATLPAMIKSLPSMLEGGVWKYLARAETFRNFRAAGSGVGAALYKTEKAFWQARKAAKAAKAEETVAAVKNTSTESKAAAGGKNVVPEKGGEINTTSSAKVNEAPPPSHASAPKLPVQVTRENVSKVLEEATAQEERLAAKAQGLTETLQNVKEQQQALLGRQKLTPPEKIQLEGLTTDAVKLERLESQAMTNLRVARQNIDNLNAFKEKQLAAAQTADKSWWQGAKDWASEKLGLNKTEAGAGADKLNSVSDAEKTAARQTSFDTKPLLTAKSARPAKFPGERLEAVLKEKGIHFDEPFSYKYKLPEGTTEQNIENMIGNSRVNGPYSKKYLHQLAQEIWRLNPEVHKYFPQGITNDSKFVYGVGSKFHPRDINFYDTLEAPSAAFTKNNALIEKIKGFGIDVNLHPDNAVLEKLLNTLEDSPAGGKAAQANLNNAGKDISGYTRVSAKNAAVMPRQEILSQIEQTDKRLNDYQKMLDVMEKDKSGNNWRKEIAELKGKIDGDIRYKNDLNNMLADGKPSANLPKAPSAEDVSLWQKFKGLFGSSPQKAFAAADKDIVELVNSGNYEKAAQAQQSLVQNLLSNDKLSMARRENLAHYSSIMNDADLNGLAGFFNDKELLLVNQRNINSAIKNNPVTFYANGSGLINKDSAARWFYEQSLTHLTIPVGNPQTGFTLGDLSKAIKDTPHLGKNPVISSNVHGICDAAGCHLGAINPNQDITVAQFTETVKRAIAGKADKATIVYSDCFAGSAADEFKQIPLSQRKGVGLITFAPRNGVNLINNGMGFNGDPVSMIINRITNDRFITATYTLDDVQIVPLEEAVKSVKTLQGAYEGVNAAQMRSEIEGLGRVFGVKTNDYSQLQKEISNLPSTIRRKGSGNYIEITKDISRYGKADPGFTIIEIPKHISDYVGDELGSLLETHGII